MAQGLSDTILVTIRITLRIRESKVRNPDPPYYSLIVSCRVRRRFVLSEHILVCHLIVINVKFVLFQVLRVVRLIRASPMLEDFCFKVHVLSCVMNVLC